MLKRPRLTSLNPDGADASACARGFRFARRCEKKGSIVIAGKKLLVVDSGAKRRGRKAKAEKEKS